MSYTDIEVTPRKPGKRKKNERKTGGYGGEERNGGNVGGREGRREEKKSIFKFIF